MLTVLARLICKPTNPPSADGNLDLYVENNGQANKLYRNEGDGTFSEVGSSAGVADSGNGVGVAWADYDGTACVRSGESVPSGYHVW